MSHAVLEAAEAALGVRLEHRGDLALLDLPRRCLLVSRGERVPQPDTQWIRGTVAAVRQLVSRGEVLVSGSARAAFDAALWTCAEVGGGAIVALAESPRDDDEMLSILPRKVLLVWPKQKSKTATAAQHQRDILMGELSDRAFAINVRASGNMAGLAARLKERQCTVEPFHCDPSPALIADPQRQDAGRRIELPAEDAWEYLTHFTREPDGPWPGEARGDYLRWLCGGIPFAPRDSFAALCRILRERKIRTCGRLMPGAVPMVCLTALNPGRTVPLRCWRRGLLRWSFTQYGLAIRTTALQGLGARAVRYATRETIRGAASAEKRFMQIQTSEGFDWSAEAEWRVDGDVDFSAIAPADMLALVATSAEADFVSSTFGIGAAVIA